MQFSDFAAVFQRLLRDRFRPRPRHRSCCNRRHKRGTRGHCENLPYILQSRRSVRTAQREQKSVRALLAISLSYKDSATIFATSAMAAARSFAVAVDPTE